jgi:UDPglucose 6-dehydrogenase
VKVAVVGLGVVGSAQVRLLEQNYEVVGYDKASGLDYPAEQIGQCEFAVIAVGTPSYQDGSINLDHVMEAVAQLPGAMPVMVRSTVIPGTCQWLADVHEGYVAHVPEFMHERIGGPWKDTTDVPFAVLGCDDPAGTQFFLKHLRALPWDAQIQATSTVTSELVKYVANLHWATQVTFVNEMAGIAKAAGADWEVVRTAWLMDSRLTDEYTSMAGFEPGFGGRCWPKDLGALIAAAKELDYYPHFLEAVQEANRRFRG